MVEISWPLALLLAPAPLLVAWFWRPAKRPSAALKVPFFAAVIDQSDVRSGGWQRFSALIIWITLLLAASRPQWVGEPVDLIPNGRDLMLAVDISGSMETDDMVLDNIQTTRLRTVQALAGEFIQRRIGDRVGLILFGSNAYLQAPLTFDRQTVETLLHEADIGLAGNHTAIGDAISLAAKRLLKSDQSGSIQPHQILILLTDGSDNASRIEPRRAIELARSLGLKIYTIGVGAEHQLVRSIFGSSRINPSVDLDEKLLQEIAHATDGQYFRARDSRELAEIYAVVDQLEPIVADSEQLFRPITELYPWPLGGALCMAIVFSLTALGIRP